MDISKLKFNIKLDYDYDEGGVDEALEDGTYDKAVALFKELDDKTWWEDYYKYMFFVIKIYDGNGKKLDLKKVLDGEWAWLDDEWSSSDPDEIDDVLESCLEFLEALKKGEEWLEQKRIDTLKRRIKDLEEELADAKKELEKMENKKNGEKV